MQRSDSALSDALARWNRMHARARKAKTIATGEIATNATPDERRRSAPPPVTTVPAVKRGDPSAMTRTQARHLALALVRNEPEYKAYEVRRTDHIYDLAVVDMWAGHSFIVHTARQLAQLLTHLHDPLLSLDAQTGSIFVKASFYEDIYNADADYADVERYTLITRFDPNDRSGAIDVTIEPRPHPRCDIGHMFASVEECISAACSSALAQGERERSLVLAEVGRRLRLYQDACA